MVSLAALANPEEVALLDELEAGAENGGAPPANPEEVALPDEVDNGTFDAPAPRAALTWKAPPRHLLVLDVNGLLIERSMAALCDVHNVPVEADQRVGAFHIYNRPGLHAFIRMLLDRFVVGVWSSARQHNLRGMVRHIFGAYEDRLAFVWGQEACSYAGTSAKKKPLFLKELGRLWTEPAFAPFGPHNTLLVDDDAYKAARNPPHTAIHPAKFLWQAGDDDALLEGGALWDYLLRLSTECTVCEWVQQHPFEVAPLPADQGGEGDSAAATRSAQQRTDAHSGASGGGTAV